MADIKALLKEARKHVDDRNFKEAQECCKNILRKDKQNYFGLVLLGKSLQDSDQAPLAYRKAIASKPELPLAWQGLSNYYETKNDINSKLKLIEVYSEILKLQIEEEKAIEVITKLSSLGCELKNYNVISTLVNYMNNDISTTLYTAFREQLINLLKADVPCKGEDIEPIINELNKIYIVDPNENLELLLCKVIMQRQNLSEAVNEIIQLQFFQCNVMVREWLCTQLCKKYIENMSFQEFEIDKHINKITEGVVNSKYPGLLKSMISYEKKLYMEAYKQCIPLINYQDADVTEADFIIKCTIQLQKWSITQKLSNNFLTKVKDESFAIQLYKYLFLSFAKQHKWMEAIAAVKDISIEDLDIYEQALLAECYIEVGESAEHIIIYLHSTKYYVQLQALILLKQHKYEETVTLLQNSTDCALTVLYLAIAFWELKQYDKCLINLLQSAKLNPDYPETFLYLGNFYYKVKDDLGKAKKCYEKAFSLNNIDSNIVKNLSEVYIRLDQKETDFELLSNFVKEASINDTWVSFRLGLHYLSKREWDNAIINFRNVIKVNQHDTTAFECMADAYYSRGSFTSALRAYNKVMSIDSGKTIHCLTRIGNIYSVLTQYEEAVNTFDKVLQLNPYSLLALKGVAETWMRIAKKKISLKIFGSARDCAQNAVNYVIKALSKQKHFFCFWKLLGDILIFVTKLPNKYVYVDMPQLKKYLTSEITRREKSEIFLEAIFCYSYIAKQKQEIASYDLASTYLAYYNETHKNVNCHISFNLSVTCIKENPSFWRNWNLLGKICLVIKKYEIAQHCFIKALISTKKWSMAQIWCNLGVLYIKLKLYKLANYCFWRGQSTMPSYCQSWIGQALIAEVIREEEAMDLFRHASRLGFHPESALGYADWVCRTLKNAKYNEDVELKYIIDGLYAIPYAIDLVEWFCNFEPDNACGYTILGILQERSGLLNAALKSYQNGLKYAEIDKKNTALLNLGRILVRTGKYDNAIKIYKAITEASLNSTIGLALALLKNGIYEEAYLVYDTALHWLCNSDDEKADLLVAMAGTMYMFKGADEAKTLLFHSIQISQKKPTAHSLFAICSLGLLHTDKSLSKLAIGELQKFEKDVNYEFDIGFLKSFLLVCEGNTEQALKILSDSLHEYPYNALLWFCMAQYNLMDSNVKAKIASGCAQKALCSAQITKSGEYNFSKIMATASIAEHIAGDPRKALILAKQGLHMYPSQAEIWAVILHALLTHNMWLERKKWILAISEYMRRYLDISRKLNRWLILVEKRLSR